MELFGYQQMGALSSFVIPSFIDWSIDSEYGEGTLIGSNTKSRCNHIASIGTLP